MPNLVKMRQIISETGIDETCVGEKGNNYLESLDFIYASGSNSTITSYSLIHGVFSKQTKTKTPYIIVR